MEPVDKFNIRLAIRVVILVVMFLFFGFGAVLPLVGLIDIWANFRKLGRSQ